jgi:peptide/nickel transport system permease protein
MAQYLTQRLLHSVIVVLGVSLVVFFLTHLSGDPAAMLLPVEASREDYTALRKALGLDRPLPIQYIVFLRRAVRGDFGLSIRHRLPALPTVLERLPATLKLAFAGMVVSLTIAVPLGVLSATRSNTIVDDAARIAALFGQAMPTFWLGILLIMLFAVRLGWFPVVGQPGLRYLILPAITLGAFAAPVQMRLLRSSLLEVLNKDYIRTAHSKGIEPKRIILRHALKNAAIPFVTVTGLQIGSWLGGALITEAVFAYPGMGLLAVNAIQQIDLPVIQAYVVVVAVCIVIVNFIVDLSYAYLDPRIRYG